MLEELLLEVVDLKSQRYRIDTLKCQLNFLFDEDLSKLPLMFWFVLGSSRRRMAGVFGELYFLMYLEAALAEIKFVVSESIKWMEEAAESVHPFEDFLIPNYNNFVESTGLGILFTSTRRGLSLSTSVI